ncbi:HAD family hydrolase [Butyrivibrio sp. AD3002]|uniref:HAD family hydrolase n=1 Tax=Butyrivibrio sp. AD3002 TaxID=1280670 RepID=UPI0003B6B5EE|nr:HAD family hydrolase [Butyrivibrio sp. AD3002]
MSTRYIWKIKDKFLISSFTNKIPKSKVVHKLKRYDIISFDIFDTLITRAVNTPSDVFDMVGERIGNTSFKELRIAAEETARRNTIGREPNIDEVYKYLDIQDKNNTLNIELETELNVCKCNPYMLEIVNDLQKIGKKIIVVSDMYLSSLFLKGMLNKNGYDQLNCVYVSNEYRVSKYDGKLYRLLSEEAIGGDSIIHVGDNEHSDYYMALENGWKALHYRKE